MTSRPVSLLFQVPALAAVGRERQYRSSCASSVFPRVRSLASSSAKTCRPLRGVCIAYAAGRAALVRHAATVVLMTAATRPVAF
jgi:hypothetical protein